MHGPVVYLTALLLSVSTCAVPAWNPYQPSWSGFQSWQTGPGISAAFYVEQRQWPAGYGIRLYLPERRNAGVHVSVDGNSLVIRSEQQNQQASGGMEGMFMQFGSFSQWLSLPGDADMANMRVTNHDRGIDIFVPRLRSR